MKKRIRTVPILFALCAALQGYSNPDITPMGERIEAIDSESFAMGGVSVNEYSGFVYNPSLLGLSERMSIKNASVLDMNYERWDVSSLQFAKMNSNYFSPLNIAAVIPISKKYFKLGIAYFTEYDTSYKMGFDIETSTYNSGTGLAGKNGFYYNTEAGGGINVISLPLALNLSDNFGLGFGVKLYSGEITGDTSYKAYSFNAWQSDLLTKTKYEVSATGYSAGFQSSVMNISISAFYEFPPKMDYRYSGSISNNGAVTETVPGNGYILFPAIWGGSLGYAFRDSFKTRIVLDFVQVMARDIRVKSGTDVIETDPGYKNATSFKMGVSHRITMPGGQKDRKSNVPLYYGFRYQPSYSVWDFSEYNWYHSSSRKIEYQPVGLYFSFGTGYTGEKFFAGIGAELGFLSYEMSGVRNSIETKRFLIDYGIRF